MYDDKDTTYFTNGALILTILYILASMCVALSQTLQCKTHDSTNMQFFHLRNLEHPEESE
jgi:hypothetical protein